MDALQASNLIDTLHGIYLYGSIPLDAFNESTSDIDVIALTKTDFTLQELDASHALHDRLAHEPASGGFGKRLAVMYIRLRDLGKRNSATELYPYSAEGEFHRSGHYDLNGVTWWLLKHHGWALLGPEPRDLPYSASWEEVMADMAYNLNSYWQRYYAALSMSKDMVLDEYHTLYAVSTLCRILSTVEDRVILSKPHALQVWRERVPESYRQVMDEALRISDQSGEPTLYPMSVELREDVVRFMQYAIERGNKALQA